MTWAYLDEEKVRQYRLELGLFGLRTDETLNCSILNEPSRLVGLLIQLSVQVVHSRFNSHMIQKKEPDRKAYQSNQQVRSNFQNIIVKVNKIVFSIISLPIHFFILPLISNVLVRIWKRLLKASILIFGKNHCFKNRTDPSDLTIEPLIRSISGLICSLEPLIDWTDFEQFKLTIQSLNQIDGSVLTKPVNSALGPKLERVCHGNNVYIPLTQTRPSHQAGTMGWLIIVENGWILWWERTRTKDLAVRKMRLYHHAMKHFNLLYRDKIDITT